MGMFEEAFNQIQQWSEGLMDDLFNSKPAIVEKAKELAAPPRDMAFVTPEMSALEDTTIQLEMEPAIAAIDAVEAVMPSDGFLLEIGQVESKLGKDPNTYRDDYHGGIMQVDEIGYADTKDLKAHPKLKAKHDLIKQEFGIDWMDTSWEDLRDPLHSAIAARLKLSNVPASIPETMEDRAAYWKKHYNTEAGKGTVEHYMESFLH